MQKEVVALIHSRAQRVRPSSKAGIALGRPVMIGRLFLAAGLVLPMTAAAQEIDPIGALLDQAQQQAEPAPAADAPVTTAPSVAAPAQPAAPPAYVPQAPAIQPPVAASLPPAPQPYVPPPPISRAQPPRPQATAPVHIDELGRTPDGPPSATDLTYESRIRGSFASAQGMQGPMDGRWVLRGPDGAELYDLMLVDKNNGVLEGAWRDPRRRGAADASGFVEDIRRTGGQLTARYRIRAGGDTAQLNLIQGSDGAWTGDLTERGERRAVVLRRE